MPYRIRSEFGYYSEVPSVFLNPTCYHAHIYHAAEHSVRVWLLQWCAFCFPRPNILSCSFFIMPQNTRLEFGYYSDVPSVFLTPIPCELSHLCWRASYKGNAAPVRMRMTPYSALSITVHWPLKEGNNSQTLKILRHLGIGDPSKCTYNTNDVKFESKVMHNSQFKMTGKHIWSQCWNCQDIYPVIG